MRPIVLVAGMVLSGSAFAQPALAPSPDSFEGCKARRIEQQRAAMKIADIDERARRFAAMPTCVRHDDGTTEVVEAAPPPPPDTSPFSPLELAVRSGISGTFVMSTNELAPKGVGPFVDVEVGYRWRREYSISIFGSYAHFSDDDVAVSNGVVSSFSVITVTDNLFAFGARVNRHFGPFWLGGGLGVMLENNVGYMDAHTTNALRTVDAYVGYRFGASRHLDAELLAIVSEAGHAFDGDRELISGQLAVGLKL